jgi:hypothetical protein
MEEAVSVAEPVPGLSPLRGGQAHLDFRVPLKPKAGLNGAPGAESEAAQQDE